ncbi:MAG TPA: tetratricopeptide repeat protein [Kiritimatiellia bacterium]|nr:tetratricopeptide repeat protein [Kiritimatiellia bacterium]HMO99653.1 tetratricopeptide repeat protein [Kiritimatiellia bacterium]
MKQSLRTSAARRGAVWFGLLMLAGGFAAEVRAMNAEERLLFANGLYRRNLFELAVPEYEALLASDAAAPMHDLAAFRLGESFRQLGRVDEAAAAYERVLAAHPDSTFIHRAAFRRAEIDWQQGRLRDAATRLQALLDAAPPPDIEAAALYYLGISQLGLDRFRDAERALRRMLRAHAASPYADYARIALADLLEQREGDATEIVALLERVAEKPETPALGAEALGKAGRIAYRRQEMNEASRLFSLLAARYPEDAWNERVRLDAAWAHLFADKLEKARALAVAGLNAATPEERPDWWYVLANIERRGDRIPEARRYYDELLTAAPDHERATASAFEAAGLAFQAADHARVLALIALAGEAPERRLSLLWMEAASARALGRQEDATAAFEAIIEDFPESDRAPSAAYQLALMRDEQGDAAGAADAFAALAGRYPRSDLAPDAWMAVGAIRQRAGELDAAISAWTQVLDGYPEYAGRDEALMGRARAEVQRDHDAEAAGLLTELIRVHTNSRFLAEALYLRGTLFEKEDGFEEAEFHYRRAVNLNPGPALLRQIQHRQVAVLQRQGRQAEAADLMNRLLAGGGGNPPLPSPLLEWLARWNLEQRDFAAADTAARRLAEVGESPAWRQIGYYITGLAARELRRPRVAMDAFTAAAEFGLNTRETAQAWHQLGLIALERKDPQTAIDHFTRAGEAASADAFIDVRARSYLQLGVAHEALDQWAEATRYYLGVGVLFDDDALTPESLFRAAGALSAQERHAERAGVLKELRQRYPESPWTGRANERWPPEPES